MSPGVVLGNASNPMRGVVFDNVTVTTSKESLWPYGNAYHCENAQVEVLGSSPAPECGAVRT